MDKSDKTLQTAHKKFIEYLKKQGRASATIVAYGKDIDQLSEYLRKKQITQVTSVLPEHIENFKEYLAENKYTPKSISRKLNSIKTFFRFLKSEGLIEENPAALVSHPRYEIVPPRILSKMEYRALRDCARDDPRAAAIIEILLQTGMRISELARLELKDITNNEIKIRPYESHPARTVPLNSPAKKAIQRWLNFRPKTKSNALLVTRTGRPLLVRNIRSALNRLFRKAGIEKATVNSLRHTFIAHQLMAGASVVLIQKIVGHKRLSTTEKYLQLVKENVSQTPKLEEL
ncbi:MAG: tyrosine-type recombinase/integrase [Microgenomates group bacterium]